MNIPNAIYLSISCFDSDMGLAGDKNGAKTGTNTLQTLLLRL